MWKARIDSFSKLMTQKVLKIGFLGTWENDEGFLVQFGQLNNFPDIRQDFQNLLGNSTENFPENHDFVEKMESFSIFPHLPFNPMEKLQFSSI